jgi:DNA-binding NarL/FixJ family response regulator
MLLHRQTHWEICDEAGNGREALEKALQHKPDVAIMDFSMPELNGLEATRKIRQALPDTEVLILTMHDSEQLAREVLAAGARGFLLKTDAKRHLIAAIEALAEHRPFFAPSVSAILLDSYLHPQGAADSRPVIGSRLTPREREILQLIAEAKTSKEIAGRLSLSVKTVEAHRTNIMNKLNLHSTSELVLYAIRNKIVHP